MTQLLVVNVAIWLNSVLYYNHFVAHGSMWYYMVSSFQSEWGFYDIGVYQDQHYI